MKHLFTCRYCNQQFFIKLFKLHLLTIHNQIYEDYIKSHLEDFIILKYKLCSECKTLCRSTSDKCGMCYTKTHKINTDQHIICHYCNRYIHSKVISIHLKTHHNTIFLNYVKDNLCDFEKMGWCKCFICGNITKKQGHINETTCSEKCLSEYRKTFL